MCNARRVNDQMMCECGLAWDVADDEPPECPRYGRIDQFGELVPNEVSFVEPKRPVRCDGYSTDEDDEK